MRADREVLKGVRFDLRQGEILGIAGLMGSGRTELVMTIFGEYAKITQGSIRLEGRRHPDPELAQRHAAGHRSGTGRSQAAWAGVDAVGLEEHLAGKPGSVCFDVLRIDDNAELNASHELCASSLEIKAPNLQVTADSLSGGNQQKVVIAKWLMTKPKVLIMDDPTRGIDVGAKYEIYKLMNDLTEQGISIIMISSDLEEVLGMSDRVMVMCEGRSTSTLDIAEATQEKIMALATGIA